MNEQGTGLLWQIVAVKTTKMVCQIDNSMKCNLLKLGGVGVGCTTEN